MPERIPVPISDLSRFMVVKVWEMYVTLWPGITARAWMLNADYPHLGWRLEVTNDHVREVPTRYMTVHAGGETIEEAWELLADICSRL